MDIRKYIKRKNSDDTEIEQPKPKVQCDEKVFVQEEKVKKEFEKKSDFGQEINVNDIGHYVKHSEKLNHQVRLHLLSNVYSPPSDYDFSKEVKPGKRKFRMAWITEGNYPWLVYSALLKGAFCLFCVLFPQSIANGYPGAFIV